MMTGLQHVVRSFVSVLVPIEDRHTVYEVFVQLLGEQLMPGMDIEHSYTYQNMTDQMLHLIGTRFRNTFGEHFYRMVIYGFYPSVRSVTVHAAVLLDPDRENYYFATTIWFSLQGYVHLGKYPLLPANVHIVESEVAYKKFHPWLSDRSYRRPYLDDLVKNYMLVVTIPAIIVMLLLIALVVNLLQFCHYLAFKRCLPGYRELKDDK